MPVYDGKLRTKLRIALYPGGEESAEPVLSDEFEGAVNPGQMGETEGK